MSYPISCDTIRRIQNNEGQTLDVRPSPDAPDSWVSIMTNGKDGNEWFGFNEISMKPEFARLLGEALIKCADELSV